MIFTHFNSDKFNIPVYTQETRFYAIKILNFVVDHFSNEENFKNKIELFLKIVLDGIENEKDPRNIMQSFKLIKIINQKLNKTAIAPFAKNFFDILEVYYPIEFIPPKNSPDKITPEMLINELNECFASNDLYVESLMEVLKGIFKLT